MCQHKAKGLRKTQRTGSGWQSPNALQLFVLAYGITLTAANIWSLSGKNKRLIELATCLHVGMKNSHVHGGDFFTILYKCIDHGHIYYICQLKGKLKFR